MLTQEAVAAAHPSQVTKLDNVCAVVAFWTDFNNLPNNVSDNSTACPQNLLSSIEVLNPSISIC